MVEIKESSEKKRIEELTAQLNNLLQGTTTFLETIDKIATGVFTDRYRLGKIVGIFKYRIHQFPHKHRL